MTIGLIDMIVLGVLIFSVLFALYRGLVSELLGISSWILAGFGALYGYTPMQSFMHRYIENERMAGICGALIIGLIILVVMTIVARHIGDKLRQSSLSGLDRLLGFAFGILRGVLFVALMYVGIAAIVSDEYLTEIKKENVSIPYIEKTVQLMKTVIPQNVQTDLGISATGSEEKPKKIGVDLKREHKMPDHKETIKRLVNDVKNDATEKASQKAKEKVKEKVKEKIKTKTETKSEAKEKAIQKASDSIPQYDAKQRESLDNMVEELMGKGE